jgi:hypothetical protein
LAISAKKSLRPLREKMQSHAKKQGKNTPRTQRGNLKSLRALREKNNSLCGMG